MDRIIYKIANYLFLTGMGVMHLAPYEQVWVIVLYYICQYGFMINLILHLHNRTDLYKYDRLENFVLIFYLGFKMIYHILNSGCTYYEYLAKLNSELWSGVFTFFVLGIMFALQGINLMGYVKER